MMAAYIVLSVKLLANDRSLLTVNIVSLQPLMRTQANENRRRKEAPDPKDTMLLPFPQTWNVPIAPLWIGNGMALPHLDLSQGRALQARPRMRREMGGKTLRDMQSSWDLQVHDF